MPQDQGQILTAIISGVATVLAAVLAGVVTALLSKDFRDGVLQFFSRHSYRILNFFFITMIGIIVITGMLIYYQKLSPRWSFAEQVAAQKKCTDALDETSSNPPFYACVGGVHAYGNIRTWIRGWSADTVKVECKKVCRGSSTNQTQCNQGCDYAFSGN